LLVQGLYPRPHLPGLGIELHPDAQGLLVQVGVVLPLVRLVGGGEGLLEAREDRLERDPLLPLELPQRLDQILVHLPPLPFGAPGAPQSNTVLAEAMASNGSLRSPASVAIRTSS